MKYGYARVSTKGQARNGNSLEEQKEKLQQEHCDEIIEEQYTGTTMKRPELQKLLGRLKKGDTLMVTKLDRLSRTAREGSQLIERLLQNGVRVNILNMGEINDTPQGKLMLQILLAFAEFERDMIVERTQAGKAIAKTRPGWREGRIPKITQAMRKQAAHMVLDERRSYKETADAIGISKSSVTRIIRAARAERIG